MSLSLPKKIAVYGVGVLLGLVVIQFFPSQKDKPPHPWKEQTAPEGSYPLTLTDDVGRVITCERQPRHLVSLAPSITEILFAMGMGDHLKGVTEWDTYPAEAKALRDQGGSIGSMDAPNRELILALHPDLVLATDLTPRQMLESLHRPPATIACSLTPTSLEDLYMDIGQIARITGVPAKGLRLVQSLRAREAAAQARIPSDVPAKRVVLLYGIQDNLEPGWTPGAQTWAGDLIERAHAVNVSASVGSSWGQVSLEALLAVQPDVILIVQGDTPEEQAGLRSRVTQLSEHPVWKHLQAIRENHIAYLPNAPFNIPGPRMIDAYESLVDALWPATSSPTAN